MTFGESAQLLRALRSERDPRPLIERISKLGEPEITPSPCSSLLALEGDVHQEKATPTPSEIEEDLSCFPPSPPEIEGVKISVFEVVHPPQSQIDDTIALCKAIVSYKVANPEAQDHIYVVTEGLETFIKAMAEHDGSVPLPITHQEYNCIAHLTYIPSFTDLIDLYYTRNEEKLKTLLKRLTTPSHISVSDNEEFIHPGEGWYEYNAHNPCHYPLVFVNEDREEEVARFIRYHPIGDGITL